MKKYTFSIYSLVTVMATSLALTLTGPALVFAATAPTLGAAATYSAFGKAGVTNIGATTHLWGNVGADATNVTGLLGTQADGAIDAGAGVEAAILAAYGALAGWGVDAPLNLAGVTTVGPGVYDVAATTLNGTLTLDGAGVYIFRSTSSITTSGGGSMNLINGATACNVFWQIPTSMTIGVGSHIEGTIITDTALISLATNASLKGRALSRTTQVTLDSNQITEPTCALPPAVTLAGGGSGSDYWLLLPLIHVTKTASPSILSEGPGSVTYTYVVTNVGKSALNTVWVTDNKCSPVAYVSGDLNTDFLLGLDEAWTYRCTKTVSQTETNIATAHGYANSTDVYDTASTTVAVYTPTPAAVITTVVGQVLGTSTPLFPNTGFPPKSESNPWNILITVGVFALVTGLAVVISRRLV